MKIFKNFLVRFKQSWPCQALFWLRDKISDRIERSRPCRLLPLEFWKWRFYDILNPEPERPFGILTFTGSAGSGKTISGIRELEIAPYKYPGVKIFRGSNCGYAHQDFAVETLDDILDAPPNSIILIDEAGKLFNSRAFKNFDPEWLLPLTQHRKKALQIIFNAQKFGLADKQIRELSTYIIECSCKDHRWVFQDWYEANGYEKFAEKPDEVKEFHLVGHHSFVQSNYLRSLYDTYLMIEKFGRRDPSLPAAEGGEGGSADAARVRAQARSASPVLPSAAPALRAPEVGQAERGAGARPQIHSLGVVFSLF